MDARQLEILCSLFRTAWPDQGASADQLERVESWMATQDVLLTERVALTEACLGHSDPEHQLSDEQSRQDAMELLATLDADAPLLGELAGLLGIEQDDLEVLRLRAHKEPSA